MTLDEKGDYRSYVAQFTETEQKERKFAVPKT